MNVEAFLKMSYGLYLISSKSDGQLSGYVANTAFQVSASPPKIAICCHKDNATSAVIDKSKVFGVSVLDKETDAGLIGLFGYHSGDEDEKFERVTYKIGNSGAPIILTHSIAYFECKVIDTIDVGTHYMYIGEVLESEVLEAGKEPLTYAYFRKEMKLMAPERAPTYVDKNKIKKAEIQPAQEVESEPGEKSDPNATFICTICGYVYDPAVGDEDRGIPPGTPFEDLPDDWMCPVCAAAKSLFMSEN